MGQVERRKFLITAGALLVAPLDIRAQQQPAKIRRIGYLSTVAGLEDAFVEGLRELGYIEGKTLVIERRYADGDNERLPSLAVELVRLNVEVIAAHSTPAAHAAQRATSAIPVVAMSVGDPVASGLAMSLARPGGNITGLSNVGPDITPKYLELLREMVPGLSRVAVLANPNHAAHPVYLKSIEAAAMQLRLKTIRVHASTMVDIVRGFGSMMRDQVEALVVLGDPFFAATAQNAQIVNLAIKYKLPCVVATDGNVRNGGLMAYGVNFTELFRRAATFVDKILKGAKPSELPFEQPTRLQLVVNAKTAKALGITIPRSILMRADKVVE